MAKDQQQPGGATLERTRPTTKEPTHYRVLLHNDDYTTMEFVMQLLEMVFHKQPAEAYRVMIQVHTQGHGLCGMYPYEVAETKVATVRDMAQHNGFPLQVSMEAE